MYEKCQTFTKPSAKHRYKQCCQLYRGICMYFMFVCFSGLEKEQEVLLTHGDSIDTLADSFKAVAQSGNIIAGNVLFSQL